MTPPEPEPLAAIAARGNRLATLRALRDLLAAALDSTTSGRDQAALARRLLQVLDAIAALEADEAEPDGLAMLVAFPERNDA